MAFYLLDVIFFCLSNVDFVMERKFDLLKGLLVTKNIQKGEPYYILRSSCTCRIQIKSSTRARLTRLCETFVLHEWVCQMDRPPTMQPVKCRPTL